MPVEPLRDGAAYVRGVAVIRAAGGHTVVRDEALAVIDGMPREAVLLGGVDRELPLTETGPLLDGVRRGHA